MPAARPGQIKRTERIRKYVDDVLQNLPAGSIVSSSDISTSLATKCRTINPNNVGMALRERDDVELVENGVWRKRG
jgi:hypothetical protein